MVKTHRDLVRDQFRALYGRKTARIVKWIAQGKSNNFIMKKEDLTNREVAAYRANVTRGTYYPFVYGNCLELISEEGGCLVRDSHSGTCQF